MEVPIASTPLAQAGVGGPHQEEQEQQELAGAHPTAAGIESWPLGSFVNSRRIRSDGFQGVWSCLERVVRVDCLELVVRLLLHGSGPDWLLVSDPEVASFRGKTGRCCNHQPPILGQCTMCCLYSLFLSTKRSGTFLCCEAMYLHIFLPNHSVERKTGRCCNHQTKILENIVSCGYVQMH